MTALRFRHGGRLGDREHRGGDCRGRGNRERRGRGPGHRIRDGRAIRAEKADHLAAQARSVVSEVPTPDSVKITNHSREVVLAVWITSISARLERRNGTPTHYEGTADPDLNGVVAPGDTWQTSISLTEVSDPSRPLRPAADEKWHVVIAFRVLDADGTWWERVDNGPPRRVLA